MAKEEELRELTYPEYWNKRYISEQKDAATLGSYEWFRNFEKLHPFLNKHLPAPCENPHILHLGCGNSTLTADLHDTGYKTQTSIDFSPVVINAMSAKYAGLNTTWSVMDVRAIQFPESSIDVAIDKSTLDAMLHGSLWDPPADVRDNVGKYVDEASHIIPSVFAQTDAKQTIVEVLKLISEWKLIGCAGFEEGWEMAPHFMKPLLARPEWWEVEVETLVDVDAPGGFEYFGFVMTRR
ncbi:Endothelin-converting enzyme [Lachnellula occidentalis]|uniref:Endothelin-converting enzyme n=1 Tax=Lachnellula occidentalis TaxID=215460 RepID=A0A8H8S8G4_9HELO|nr:Endothelin-converting enzyme [Lachnellula occidentalis]